mgnify:CR=1 FL=1
MLLDYEITKPAHIRGYALHRMVTELVGEAAALFSDEGATLLIRTTADIDASRREVKTLANGQLTAFELRACVSKKRKGKHIYLHSGDWQSRHAWLKKKAQDNGFEILTLHSSSKMTQISDNSRSFKVDQTDFTGILKVNDASLFKSALANGIGSTARTFGFGMLVI